MDPKYGSGTCNHSRTDTVVAENETEASSPITFLVDSKNESESRTSSDAILNESTSGSSKSSELSCSIFSSSDGSSSDDFILVNPKIASNSISLDVTSSKYSRDAKPLSQDDYNGLNGMFCKLELNTSTSSASQISDISDESLLPTMSITKSPSIQMMERQGGYDPNRVPSSIFGSKSSTPKEWSAASDESLFSINVSLSRDHILLMGGDIWKSGELHKSGEPKNKCVELDRSEEVSKSSKLISFRDSPTVKGGKHTERICDTEKGVVTGNNLIEAGSQHEPIKKELHFEEEIKVGRNAEYSTTIGHSKGNEGFIDSYTTIHHSDGSGTSLAFPVSGKSTEPFCHIVYYTRKKSIWPLCFYSYCSCGSCCSRWPSSCFKCSGCLSCKWSSWICCSCKWLSWSGCCHKLPSR
ncbi:suppressor protein SRP40-like [Nicotiana sylvestris]